VCCAFKDFAGHMYEWKDSGDVKWTRWVSVMPYRPVEVFSDDRVIHPSCFSRSVLLDAITATKSGGNFITV
jgi:hypothetical protein